MTAPLKAPKFKTTLKDSKEVLDWLLLENSSGETRSRKPNQHALYYEGILDLDGDVACLTKDEIRIIRDGEDVWECRIDDVAKDYLLERFQYPEDLAPEEEPFAELPDEEPSEYIPPRKESVWSDFAQPDLECCPGPIRPPLFAVAVTIIAIIAMIFLIVKALADREHASSYSPIEHPQPEWPYLNTQIPPVAQHTKKDDPRPGSAYVNGRQIW